VKITVRACVHACVRASVGSLVRPRVPCGPCHRASSIVATYERRNESEGGAR